MNNLVIFYNFFWKLPFLDRDGEPLYSFNGIQRQFLAATWGCSYKVYKQPFRKKKIMVGLTWPLVTLSLHLAPYLITWASFCGWRNKAKDGHWNFTQSPSGGWVRMRNKGRAPFKWAYCPFTHLTLTAISSRHCFPQRQLKFEMVVDYPSCSVQDPLVTSVTKTKGRDSFCHFDNEERNSWVSLVPRHSYIYTHIYIYICVYIYVYIYIKESSRSSHGGAVVNKSN